MSTWSDHWGKISAAAAALGLLGAIYAGAAQRGLPVFATELEAQLKELKKDYDERFAKGTRVTQDLTRSLNASRRQLNTINKGQIESELLANTGTLAKPEIDQGYRRLLQERQEVLKEQLEENKREREELKKPDA